MARILLYPEQYLPPSLKESYTNQLETGAIDGEKPYIALVFDMFTRAYQDLPLEPRIELPIAQGKAEGKGATRAGNKAGTKAGTKGGTKAAAKTGTKAATKAAAKSKRSAQL